MPINGAVERFFNSEICRKNPKNKSLCKIQWKNCKIYIDKTIKKWYTIRVKKKNVTDPARRVLGIAGKREEKTMIDTRFYFSRGNKKLQPNASTAFLLWNIPAVQTCPYRTATCEKFCYARKAEKVYPDCLPSRKRNFEFSRSADFVDAVAAYIRDFSRKTRKKTVVVRIHEAGDFYNADYTKKWLQIADAVRDDKKIVFMAYTKSFRFFDGVKLPKNFKLRASVWADTSPEQLALIDKNKWPIYTAVEKFKPGDAFTRCRCSDCATCKKCWQNYHDIRCEIH